MKRTIALLLAFILAISYIGYVSGETSETSTGVSSITLGGNSITFEGTGATIDGSTITIESAGTYTVTGGLKDGQIRVDTKDAETVKLILNGATIASSTSAPIYVINADKTVITLSEGTKNYVSDGTSYIIEETASDEPNAAIFSNDDLTINGEGSLTVTGNYNHGIVSKDDLKMNGGSVTVNAVNDGIKGRNSVTVRAGNIFVESGGDGIQSNNDEEADKGYVSIEGGSLTITSGKDGIQAETSLNVSGGTITITSGGGSSNGSSNPGTGGNPRSGRNTGTIPDTSDSSDSAKGLKAGGAITISGGTITIDSSDDSINTHDNITINGGNFKVSSGDDGIHADSSLMINGGDIRIIKSYEGIESEIISINAGVIHIAASDDGINVVSSDDTSSNNEQPGQFTFISTENTHLYLNGGYIVIDANGDGIDINGPIDMVGGTVIVNGPTNNGNGALDYFGTFKMTGGYLIAAGSSGMAMAPGTLSTQYSVMVTFSSAMPAGTMVHIESDGGKNILTVMPAKTFQSIVLSSPDLIKAETYLVFTGGSSTGIVTDGLYSGGAYTPGTKITTFTISSTITNAGSSNNPGNNPNPNPGNPNPEIKPEGKPVPTSIPTTAPTQSPSGTATGTLSVTSVPSGAIVSLDGLYKGVTPVIFSSISTGIHQLKVTKTGYQDYSTSVSLTPGKMVSVPVFLKVQSGSTTPTTTPTTAPTPSHSGTATGTLYVTSTPRGASIYLDEVYKGITPIIITGISNGIHQLKVTETGYQDYSTSVSLTPGKMAGVPVILKVQSGSTTPMTTPTTAPTQSPSRIATGTLYVTSAPKLANVYLDGTFKGVTPLSLTGVSFGFHQIKLTRSGYQDYLASVEVIDGKTNSVSATLDDSPGIESSFTRSYKTDLPTSSRIFHEASVSSTLRKENSVLISPMFYENG